MINVIKKFNMILILLVLLFVSIGSVCAAEDINDTLSIDEVSEINGGEIISASEHTVNSGNYNQYFASNGDLVSSSVNAGDTIILSGDFSSRNFTFNKKLNIVGSGGTITNGIVSLNKGASGSTVSGLTIVNSLNYYRGIYLDGATNCYVHDNKITCSGASAYPICLNNKANFNNISNNKLESIGATYGHGSRGTPVILLSLSDNNYIANNDIRCADANAIYLSSYPGGIFKGGESYNNYIYKNNIQYTVNVTSWAYGIQLMGGNNTVDSNVVNGAYRGVSSSNFPSNKVINNIISVTGTDYATGIFSGGDYGIALASSALIRNNTVTGAFSGAGISAGDDSVIENNFVNASKGYGITAPGEDVKIIANTIYTTSSAGVEQQGRYSGIVVDRNTIVSNSGIGVLLSKASKTKYPSDITITNNQITTSNKYIINVADADKDSYTISNNTGSGTILTPAGEVDPTVPDFVFNGTTHYITPANYHNYIDDDGNLKNDFVSDGDILYFNGTFDDKQIKITSSVKVTGQNPVFNNSTFVVTTDSVWIENITLINKGAPRLDAWGIFVADTQIVKIVNNNIAVYDPVAAYAVYIYKSSKVYVEDNTLMSNGNSLTYTLLGYGAEESEFKNNTIICIGTDEIHGFEDSKDINVNSSEVCIGQCLGDVLKEHCLDGTNIVPEIYRTYGILMIKSSNNTLIDNDVSVTSGVNESLVVNSTNSLVGIDFYYDCNNNLIANNKIDVAGLDNYLYGAGALAQSTGQFSSTTAANNTFVGNDITVTGPNVVEGFIFGQGCEDNKVLDNEVKLTTNRTAYAVTLESSDKTTIDGNNITMDASIAYGVEAFQSSGNTIENNEITGNGNIVSGIVGTKSSDNVIQNNVINANGDGEEPGFVLHDVIKAPNSGIYMDGESNNNLIDKNTITTNKGYPVEFSDVAKDNTVTNNYLKGEKGSGDAGVNASKSNTVKDNFASSFDNLKMNDTVIEYCGELTVTLEAGAEANGANVLFTLNNVIIGNTTVKDGKASATYTLNKNFNVGNYTVSALVSKEKFKSETVTSNLEIIKSDIVVDVVDVVARPGSSISLIATVLDANNNPVAGVEVRFYRNTLYMGRATSDENSVAKTSYAVPASLSGNFTLFATVTESDNYNQGSGNASYIISSTAKIPTKFNANDVEMYCKDGTRFVATLTDFSGNPISNVTVSHTINGVTREKVTDEKGQFSFALGLDAGKYPVSLSFAGNNDYAACVATANVVINPTMSSKDLVKMYKNATKYEVSVVADGKPVANLDINLNINGVIYTRTTNTNGVAALAINLNAGDYIITAWRTDTGETISNTITVKSLLVDNNDVDMFYRNGTGYTVKVIKQDGTVAGAGEVVKFNINGVFYERKTNDEGIARLNLNLEPNDYIITAEYMDCRVSNNIHIKPVLTGSDLTKQFGDITPFSAKLVTGHGLPAIGKTVTFNINGVFYNRTTDLLGIARLNINLLPGVYIITSMFEENGAITSDKVTITSILG